MNAWDEVQIEDTAEYFLYECMEEIEAEETEEQDNDN